MNSNALTKLQTVLLVVVVVVAIGGSMAYFYSNGEGPSSDTIKIGVLADLDGLGGKEIWQGAKLAVEQLNAEGGILGKQIELIREDHDIESGADMVKIDSALIRLIDYHHVDFIIGQTTNEVAFTIQEKISEHKKIFTSIGANDDALSQRVLDDYDKYKYFFTISFNQTSGFLGMSEALSFFKDNTDFRKIGFISLDVEGFTSLMHGLDSVLTDVYGFDTVYKGTFPLGTYDFSSYFAAAETEGVEILIPLIVGDEGLAFIKEWADRQSPMVIASGYLAIANHPECYEWTDGKCEDIATSNFPITTGYPLTSKTVPVRNQYINRWNAAPSIAAGITYDFVRFTLFDAIERVATIETDVVIDALEGTSVETTSARNFVFTDSHGVMMGENPNDPNADYTLAMVFQWQDGELVPVYPEKIRIEAGATYTYPDWPGPWDDLD